jgi:hypothetical protein
MRTHACPTKLCIGKKLADTCMPNQEELTHLKGHHVRTTEALDIELGPCSVYMLPGYTYTYVYTYTDPCV